MPIQILNPTAPTTFMITKSLLLPILLLMLPVLSQAQNSIPRAVEPIRVSVSTQGEAPYDQEFDKLICSELRGMRNVVISSRRAKYSINFVIAQIMSKGKHVGYVVAMLSSERNQTDNFSLFIEDDLTTLAIRIINYLKNEWGRQDVDSY